MMHCVDSRDMRFTHKKEKKSRDSLLDSRDMKLKISRCAVWTHVIRDLHKKEKKMLRCVGSPDMKLKKS